MGSDILLSDTYLTGPCVTGIFFLVFIVSIFLSNSLKKISNNQKGIVLSNVNNKFIRSVGPGTVFVMPLSEKLVIVNMTPVTIDISNYRFFTKDKKEVNQNLKIIYNIKNPVLIAQNTKNLVVIVRSLAISITEEHIKNITFEEYKNKNWQLTREIRKEMNAKVGRWGIEITSPQENITKKIENIHHEHVATKQNNTGYKKVHPGDNFLDRELFDDREKFKYDKNKNYCSYCHADLPNINILGYAKCRFCGKRNKPNRPKDNDF